MRSWYYKSVAYKKGIFCRVWKVLVAIMEQEAVKEIWGLVLVVPRATMLLGYPVILVMLDHLVTMVMMGLKVTLEYQVS